MVIPKFRCLQLEKQKVIHFIHKVINSYPHPSTELAVILGPSGCGKSTLRGINSKKREEIARKYIDLVGLKGFENALPKTFSGGMKQRVAIARVPANKPEMLLGDKRLVLQPVLFLYYHKI
ncbi:MAG: ATP-binding cassette domain-containing protein [Desulfotomaculum sp.]|nr:ATP-binding cassette domain-containing protein [Desulfotomaculum sp.]